MVLPPSVGKTRRLQPLFTWDGETITGLRSRQDLSFCKGFVMRRTRRCGFDPRVEPEVAPTYIRTISQDDLSPQTRVLRIPRRVRDDAGAALLAEHFDLEFRAGLG